MGSTFYNYHIHTEDVQTVRQAIEEIQGIGWIAAEPINGWVSVYPYSFEMLPKLAEVLRLPLIHLNLYDDDIASYQLFENGVLVDEYDSAPDYWVGSSDENGDEIMPKTSEELARLAPRPEKLLPYCLAEFSQRDVEMAFGKSYRDTFEQIEQFAHTNSPDYSNLPDFRSYSGIDLVHADSVIMELFRLLGLDQRSLYSGYGRMVEEEDFSLIFVGEQFFGQEDLDRLLVQAVSNIQVMPETGQIVNPYPDKELAAFKKWLALGANPNTQTAYTGMSPLMLAVKGGSVEVVRILLESGADPNHSFEYSQPPVQALLTPLTWAVNAPNSHELIGLLKSYGARD